jgi:hypothetical protein
MITEAEDEQLLAALVSLSKEIDPSHIDGWSLSHCVTMAAASA